jgi:HEAT repeat protein
LSSRIGIGVVLEEFIGEPLLITLIPTLGKLTQHKDVRIRADAYHYLGLTADKSAIPFLEAGKNDEDSEVKGIASDSLDEILNA